MTRSANAGSVPWSVPSRWNGLEQLVRGKVRGVVDPKQRIAGRHLAAWRLAEVPKCLTTAEVERVVHACMLALLQERYPGTYGNELLRTMVTWAVPSVRYRR